MSIATHYFLWRVGIKFKIFDIFGISLDSTELLASTLLFRLIS
jgi:hypothetical protein